ncbi:hypothetical protein C3F00_034740 [Pseudomonas sp. MWU13-2860]|nr:hypothetical protein C3F00_034740 [Pseudomonas sp. MWU13-2860]
MFMHAQQGLAITAEQEPTRYGIHREHADRAQAAAAQQADHAAAVLVAGQPGAVRARRQLLPTLGLTMQPGLARRQRLALILPHHISARRPPQIAGRIRRPVIQRVRGQGQRLAARLHRAQVQ